MIVHYSRRVAIVAIFISAVFDPNTARGQNAELRRGNPPRTYRASFTARVGTDGFVLKGDAPFEAVIFGLPTGKMVFVVSLIQRG